MESQNIWRTHSINTAECFEYRGFFTITLTDDVPIVVPRLRGLARVGNLIRVPNGTVKKSLQPNFLITVPGENPFSLLQEAVREIRDADEEPICTLKEEGEALRAVPVRVGTALFTSPRQVVAQCRSGKRQRFNG